MGHEYARFDVASGLATPSSSVHSAAASGAVSMCLPFAWLFARGHCPQPSSATPWLDWKASSGSCTGADGYTSSATSPI